MSLAQMSVAKTFLAQASLSQISLAQKYIGQKVISPSVKQPKNRALGGLHLVVLYTNTDYIHIQFCGSWNGCRKCSYHYALRRSSYFPNAGMLDCLNKLYPNSPFWILKERINVGDVRPKNSLNVSIQMQLWNYIKIAKMLLIFNTKLESIWKSFCCKIFSTKRIINL